MLHLQMNCMYGYTTMLEYILVHMYTYKLYRYTGGRSLINSHHHCATLGQLQNMLLLPFRYTVLLQQTLDTHTRIRWFSFRLHNFDKIYAHNINQVLSSVPMNYFSNAHISLMSNNLSLSYLSNHSYTITTDALNL